MANLLQVIAAKAETSTEYHNRVHGILTKHGFSPVVKKEYDYGNHEHEYHGPMENRQALHEELAQTHKHTSNGTEHSFVKEHNKRLSSKIRKIKGKSTAVVHHSFTLPIPKKDRMSGFEDMGYKKDEPHVDHGINSAQAARNAVYYGHTNPKTVTRYVHPTDKLTPEHEKRIHD